MKGAARSSKKRASGNKGLSIQRGPLFAPRQKTVLRYSEYVPLDPGVGVALGYVFAANGCYDPNISGTGHQPKGFDQWMAFYDHYHVESSVVTVYFTSNSATAAQQSAMVGISLRDSSTTVTGTDLTSLIEDGVIGCHKYAPLGIVNTEAAAQVHNKYSAATFFGTKSLLDTSQLRGDASSNPSDLAYYHVWYAPMSGGLDLTACIALVVIDYTVILTEPRPIGQS
jgi:hypothetical protein